MAKLSEYKGGVLLTGGLEPKNNGNFPLIEAHDVLVGENDKRLDEVLEKAEEWTFTLEDGSKVVKKVYLK
jgi:hypothetical protein